MSYCCLRRAVSFSPMKNTCCRSTSEEARITARILELKQDLRELSKRLGKSGFCGPHSDAYFRGPSEAPNQDAFIKLQQRIAKIQEEVRLYDQLHRQRRQVKSPPKYWGRVKESGTKYLLSHDRVVATQTG